jgi:cytochrome c oxidase cbb3-type subunit 1
MELFVRRFIRSSLVWFGIGVLLGLGIAIWPGRLLVIRPAHVHANLLGFVTMMIFGVAYHVLPRFAGAPLHSRALAATHVWVANAGLALLVSGWILRPLAGPPATPALHTGAVLSVVSAGMFIYNIWRTLNAAPSPFGQPRVLHGARGMPHGRSDS